MSPREAWLELARDIIKLFLRVNLLVGEVVSNLRHLKKEGDTITALRFESNVSESRRSIRRETLGVREPVLF